MPVPLARKPLNLLRRVLASRGDGRPSSPVLEVHSPQDGAVATGLLPITGWAFAGTRRAIEGIVQIEIDDETEWTTLERRCTGGGMSPDITWSKYTGFETALNTFFLPNGEHRIKFRVKSYAGEILATREITIRVDNVGRLAETTANLLKAYPNAKRIWTDLIDSSDFPYDKAGQVAWFDQPDAEAMIPEIMARHQLDSMYEPHLQHFIREGYIVLENFVSTDWCTQISADLDSLLASGVLKTPSKGQRVEKLFEHSKATRDLWSHPEILKLLSAIYDDVALPCQTLNFTHGSQQDVHQDLVHLTPFPSGFMNGVWIALEDVHPDAGPLVVYPRSHKLERLYTRTVPVDKVTTGDWPGFVAKYRPRLQQLLDDAGLEPLVYLPKAGTVLIWHEALAHGGSHRKSDVLTRKSMVSHYFARGGMAFYDSTGLPGWTHED
jgi:ectoine hydroxylase-related dioxygenase (phytanoyl-CoA dioxygenase family)